MSKKISNVAEGKLTITAAGPMIVLHQQNREVEFVPEGTSVFVSENFFQTNDRYRFEDGVQSDKFVEGDFLANVLYGAEVVITNPTSTPMAIDLLLQIPQRSNANRWLLSNAFDLDAIQCLQHAESRIRILLPCRWRIYPLSSSRFQRRGDS